MKNVFLLFLFLLCSIECIMFPRLDLEIQNQFYTRYIDGKFIKSRYENDVKSIQIIKKSKKYRLMENSSKFDFHIIFITRFDEFSDYIAGVKLVLGL